MGKLTKKEAKKLDGLLEALYHSDVRANVFSDKPGLSFSEGYGLMGILVEDGYAETLSKREDTTNYGITQKGRSLCRAGGYLQPFRERRRVTWKRLLDYVLGIATAILVGWILKILNLL
jgi:hypothetical protein